MYHRCHGRNAPWKYPKPWIRNLENSGFEDRRGPKESYHAMNKLDLSYMGDLQISPNRLGAGVLGYRRRPNRFHQTESCVEIVRLFGICQR